MQESTAQSPLVTVSKLAEQLDNPDWVVVDCRFSLTDPDAGRAAWEEGHIPGAFYADLDRDLAASVADDGAGGRHPLPDPGDLEHLVRSWGVHENSRIVAYDDMGNAIAARLWWLLRWLGHEGAAVLDGGLTAWTRAGQSLSSQEPEMSQGRFSRSPGSMPVIDADSVAARLAAGKLVLFDARAAERFIGAVEPLDRIAGHVPGARNAPVDGNLSADKCFRAPEDLQAYYRAAVGDNGIDNVACMCGSGVTACHTLLALEIAGLPGAALYTGSWSDWISSDERPIATNNEQDEHKD